MEYIDGLVAAVPNENKNEYIEHAKRTASIFKNHGAVRLIECWGDDVPDGEVTSFPKAVKCQADETVVFSWIVWPSKEVRDVGMEAIMKDEQMSLEVTQMPFDGTRLMYGGFRKVVDE